MGRSLAVCGVLLVFAGCSAAFRSKAIGKQVKVVQFDRDMRKGEMIDPTKDVSIHEVSQGTCDGLGDVVIVSGPEEVKMLVQSGVLNRNVVKGTFFSASMILAEDPDDFSSQMHDPGNVLRRVPIRGPGGPLHPGARVNLIALIPGKDGKTHAERIIEDVWVNAVGGHIASQDTTAPVPGGVDEGIASNRDIVIEVSPQASLELEEVLHYVGGGVDVERLNPLLPRPRNAGQVKPGLLQILQAGTTQPARTGALLSP